MDQRTLFNIQSPLARLHAGGSPRLLVLAGLLLTLAAVATFASPAGADHPGLAPSNVQAEVNANGDQLLLTWDPPPDTTVSNYYIYLRQSHPSGQAFNIQGTRDGASAREFTFSHHYFALAWNPGEYYDFSVGACTGNSVGSTHCSGPGKPGATLQMAPIPGPPRKVDETSGGPFGGDQVSLFWQAPLDGGSPITGYKLRHRITGASTWTDDPRDLTASATLALVVVSGIANRTEATEFQVRAVNAKGAGSWSDSIVVGGVPDAPAGLTATGHGSGVRFSWDYPANDGGKTIANYYYQYRVHGQEDFGQEYRTEGDETSIDMSGLVANQNYDFRVAAWNEHRQGPWATFTVAGRPGGPGGLTAQAVPNTSYISLSWTPPSTTGQASTALPAGTALTKYLYQYRLSGSGVGGWRYGGEVAAPATTATVRGLLPDTGYDFRVRAHTAHREGWFSGPVAVITAELPTISASAPATEEGDDVTFTVQLSAAAIDPVTLDWTTADGSATMWADYRPASGSVTIPAGGASATFTVATVDDDRTEGDETFTVRLSAPLGGLPASVYFPEAAATATATITDDDPVMEPGAIRNLRVKAYEVAEDDVYEGLRLTWRAPTRDGGEAIAGYDYEVRGHRSGTAWGTGGQGSVAGLRVDLPNLADRSNYDLRVRARNASLPGPWVEVTVSGRPAAPGDFTATPIAESSDVALSWTVPTRTAAVALADGREITQIVYQYRETGNGNSGWQGGSTGPDATGVTVSGLAPNQSYDFRARADTANRYGWFSAPVSSRTDAPDMPPATAGEPIGDRVLFTTDGPFETSLASRFSDPNGDVLTYSAVSDNVEAATVSLDGATLSVTAVAPGAAVITVTATDATNRSGTQTFTITVRDPAPPGPPTEVRVSADGDRVTVSWTPPASSGDKPINGYAVEYRPGGAAGPWTEAGTADSNATSFTATLAGFDYSTPFRVRASSIAGPGPWSANATIPRPAGPGAAIAATYPSPLTVEDLAADLDSRCGTLTVNLKGGLSYAESLTTDHFSLVSIPADAGLSVASVRRASDTSAVLELAVDGNPSTAPYIQFVVSATAHSGGEDLTTGQTVVFHVRNTGNLPPIFLSGQWFNVVENTRFVGYVYVVDDQQDTVRLSLSGPDAQYLRLDAATGELTFPSLQDADHDTPQDTNRDNTYDMTVTAVSGVCGRRLTSTQDIQVIVHEATPPGDFKVGYATQDSLTLTWTVPPDPGPEVQQRITGYSYVRIFAYGSTRVFWVDTDACDAQGRCTATDRDLELSGNYAYRVRAHYAPGSSKWTAGNYSDWTETIGGVTSNRDVTAAGLDDERTRITLRLRRGLVQPTADSLLGAAADFELRGTGISPASGQVSGVLFDPDRSNQLALELADNVTLPTSDVTLFYTFTAGPGKSRFNFVSSILSVSDFHVDVANLANPAPTITDPLPDVTARPGRSPATLDTGHYFYDDDRLTYSAESSDTEVATVAVNGGEIVVTGVDTGTATITVTAADTSGGTATQSFTATVPSRPAIAVAGATAQEGEALTFIVTLSDLVEEDISLTWSTADGTATAPPDYVALAGATLTIPAQTSSVTFQVETVEDGELEPEETFTVTLAAAAEGLPGRVFIESATANGTITDDDLPPPGQVTGLVVTAQLSSLALSWDLAADAEGYKVQWKSGDQDYAEDSSEDRQAAVEDTAYTINDLTPNVDYTVRVISTRANAAAGPPSLEQTWAPLSGAPGQVSDVAATPGFLELEVSWQPLPDATGYRVQWKSGEEEYAEERQAETADPYHTITDLTEGVRYTVRVIAFNTYELDGDLSRTEDGPPSAEVDAVPMAPTPDQVSGLALQAQVEALEVSWSAADGADAYRVQWKSGEEDYSPDRQATVTGTGYKIVGLEPGVEYTVRVIATRQHAPAAPPSDEQTAAPNAPAPGQVAGLTVTPLVEGLDASWDRPANADGYRIQWRKAGQSYDWFQMQWLEDAELTNYTITDLAPGVRYTVRVTPYRVQEIAGFDAKIDGPASPDIPGVPRAAAPAQVSGLTVTPAVESLALTWDAADNADGYVVQWKSGEEDYSEDRQADSDDTAYTITDLSSGTAYTVRVIATRYHAAAGPPSAEATGTPLFAAPGQVTDVTATAGVEEILVEWTAIPNASSYKVQWRSGDQGYDESRQELVSGGETTAYTIPDLAGGTEYTVRVIATGQDDADGPPSDEATGTPTPADAAG